MAVILAYITVVLIWTTTPLAIVWSGHTDWFFGVAARTALGALLILPFLYWHKGQSFQYNLSAIKVYVFAAFPILGGMTLMYWSAQFLPSGWIAILFALTPVMTGVFAYFLLPNQAITIQKSLAIVLTLIGLVTAFAPNLHTDLLHHQLLAIAVALLSVCFHSLGSVLVKRCGTQLPALHVVIGALWVSVMGQFFIDPTTLFHWPELMPKEVYAILYAATVGSVIGFLLYFYLIRHVDAMKVALIPVITPVFALLIGHFLNNETLNISVWLGAGLVITGLILFEWRFKSKTTLLN